jgi:hypothetical protein
MRAQKSLDQMWHGFVNRIEAYRGESFGGWAAPRFAKPFHNYSANEAIAASPPKSYPIA